VTVSKELAAHEAWVRDNAAYYSAVIFRGRGQFYRKEAPTLEGIRALAREMLVEVGGLRPAGIYAVRDAYEVHVENVIP